MNYEKWWNRIIYLLGFFLLLMLSVYSLSSSINYFASSLDNFVPMFVRNDDPILYSLILLFVSFHKLVEVVRKRQRVGELIAISKIETLTGTVYRMRFKCQNSIYSYQMKGDPSFFAVGMEYMVTIRFFKVELVQPRSQQTGHNWNYFYLPSGYCFNICLLPILYLMAFCFLFGIIVVSIYIATTPLELVEQLFQFASLAIFGFLFFLTVWFIFNDHKWKR